ncbi:response regulator [Paenibacillus aceris]|uniref:Two-component system response regulator YesN n=1 Tax=Paenibacillus aceris TaxID=869555 RepID=A0ABS4I4R6_9BACL|nr:two-component system response regulator YesN [Paenibacillus aceris]NHW33435.1 response regulator [Paenibacillus aceris]
MTALYKVLIVEDEKPAREVFKQMIAQEKEIFELVGEAVNGKRGLELFKEFQPHFLITDITMPVMSGIEMLQALKQLEQDMPETIILSCHKDFHFAQKAIELGASSYLIKEDCLVQESLLTDTLKNFIPRICKREDDRQKIETIERKNDAGLSEEGTDLASPVNSIMMSVIEQLRADLTVSISLEDMAAKVGYSIPYLSSLFKKTTGQTYTQYMMTMRVQAAKRLLLTTDLRTFQVAEQVGMENYRHFNKIFKRMVGMSPKEFKQSNHQLHSPIRTENR